LKKLSIEGNYFSPNSNDGFGFIFILKKLKKNTPSDEGVFQGGYEKVHSLRLYYTTLPAFQTYKQAHPHVI